MKEIADLARIVTLRRLAGPPILDLDSPAESKENLLVAAMVRTTGATQLQLVREVYGRNSAANTGAFRKLRSRVQAKLLNHLYFLDHSDSRHLVSRRYEMEVLSLFHQVSALHAEGEYVLATRLLRKCQRLAAAGEFTQYNVLATKMLRNIYSDQQQTRQFQATARKLQKLQLQLAQEDEANRLLAEVKLGFGGPIAIRQKLLHKMADYVKQAEDLHRKVRSYNTFLVLYRIRLSQEELLGNFAEIINLTNDAARRMQQGKLNARRFDKRFNHFMSIYAHLRGRQPVQGLKLAEVYARDFHPSSGNWFYFHEHYLLLALHAGHYERAQRVLHTVSKNPSFSKQRAAAQQRWDMFRAYLELLQPSRSPAQQARAAAMLTQTMPDYSRDKRGHNIAILVLQTLHYLRLRDLEAVLLRMERLRKYQQRHLREAEALRSRLFLRLLALLVEKDFDPDECAVKGQNLLTKLRATPTPGDAFAHYEIVPYENLWLHILQILRQGPRLSVSSLEQKDTEQVPAAG